jgi:hypothetical protein
VQSVLEIILNMRILDQRIVRLWPQISYAVGPAELKADQVVHLVCPRLGMVDSVRVEDFALD